MTPSYAALFRSPYRALMVAALGATFLGSLDALMVITALPTAAEEIGGVGLIAATVGATSVTVAITFPIAGTVIDRSGAGLAFAIACILFAIANVVGGLAPSMPVVTLSRAILGLGAGFMFAVPLGLFAIRVPDELRPRAFGINAAMWGVSALIGPLLGAILTSTVGWRWVFWVNLPMIAIVAWAGKLALRQHPPVERVTERASLNVIGPLLLGAIVASMLAASHDSIPVAVLIPTALVAAVGFVWYERHTSTPVFTHSTNAIAANVAAFGAGVVFLGAETYLPLQLQVGFHHGVAVVGIALLLCTLGWTTGSMGAARINLGTRSQVMLGTAMTVVATVVMALPFGGAVLVIVAYACSGLGMGIASPALFAAVLADKVEGKEGQATSTIPLTRQIGSGVGAAVAGIVFAGALSAHQIAASEHVGAYVPDVVGAARLTYAAVAAVGLVGVVATRWLYDDRRGRSPVGVEPDHVPV
jgi:MFS family permease